MNPIEVLQDKAPYVISRSTAKEVLIIGTVSLCLLLMSAFLICSLGSFYKEGPKWDTCNHQVITYHDGRHDITYNITYTNPETKYSMKNSFTYGIDDLGNVGWLGKRPIEILKGGRIPIRPWWFNGFVLAFTIISIMVWCFGSLCEEEYTVILAARTWISVLFGMIPITKIKGFFGR